MTKKNDLALLNTLRAIAAWMVCLFHASFLLKDYYPFTYDVLSWGQEGVYVFFIISGVVLPWSMDQSQYQWRFAGKFMLKRMLRLYPPFLVSVVICAFGFYGWKGMISPEGLTKMFHSVTFAAPFLGTKWVNDVYWTLFVEFQFYLYLALIFPFFVSSKAWVRTTALVVTLALSFLSKSFEPKFVKVTLFFHLPVFTMGYYVYLYLKARIGEKEFWMGLLLSTLVCLYLTGILHGLKWRIVTTAFLTVLVIIWVKQGNRWLDRLGEISYSFYLTHWFVISTCNHFFYHDMRSPLGSVFFFLLIQVGSILLAQLFYRVVEKPSLLWTKKVRYTTDPPKA
jgi:peptidoglycan/LPS O-acetylase OafA/YrhL